MKQLNQDVAEGIGCVLIAIAIAILISVVAYWCRH